jgi:cobalt/nickel transport system permease protein
MHIPDGLLDTKTIVITAVFSAAVLAYGTKRTNKELGEKQVPLIGVTAAFVFAAQMLNFPVAGGTSGHFLGATLAAILLGPWISCLIMAVVLTIQCLGFADGGLTALGANVFNMGVIGGVVSYQVFVAIKYLLPKTRTGFFSAAAITSWFSVAFSAVTAGLELVISGVSPARLVLPAMFGVHALIGIGEAIITVMVLSVVLNTRPDLIGTYTGLAITKS